MSTPPILQTPLNEEKNTKRDGEDATPFSRPIAQTYVKRKRSNPFFKTRVHKGNGWDNRLRKGKRQVGHSLWRNTRTFHHTYSNARKTTECGSILF